ncbi:MAG TPA: isoprenylcysteine carboxylmethyltransferase family protein [bacterium]|nr:isoprenylcysteine carboxylmethyltransferase family protein [bacterium]
MNPYAQSVRFICLLWCVVWLAAAFSAKKTVRRESIPSFVAQRIFLIPGYFLLFSPYSAFGLGAPWVPSGALIQGGGVALCLLGLLYSVWARAALGRNWSGTVTLKEDHQLIQSGPYAYSRHPIYTGILCASFGVALEEGRRGALLGFVLAAISFHLKMATEEAFMREQFGPDYGAYAAKVKKLIPFVY